MKSLVIGALVLGALAAVPTASEARDGCGPGRWFNGYRCVGGRYYAPPPPPPMVYGFYGPRYYAPPPRPYWRHRHHGYWRGY